MAKRGKGSGGKGTTIIRREEPPGEAGGHGGAWKVAYADFVTAMMAFFLVMWLLNATTEDQRKGLADYFSPNNLMSHASSGTGLPFGGRTALENGALVSDRGAVQVFPGNRPITEPNDNPGDDMTSSAPPASVPTPPPTQPGTVAASSAGPASAQAAPRPPPAAARLPTPLQMATADAEKQENQRFQKAAEDIRRSIASDPALAGLAGQVLVDVTPEGLRVQLVDAAKQAMFPLGSPEPNAAAEALLRKIVPVVQQLSGQLDIEGHTDAAPYPGPDRTNWDLSAERANAARRLLTQAGIPDSRIQEVVGDADRELLIKNQPLAPANRRIAIIVLRSAPRAAGK